MDVRMSTRHTAVPPSFPAWAEGRAQRLERYNPRLQTVELLVDSDHGRSVVEVRAQVPGSPIMVGRAEGGSERVALDRALERVGRQLRRQRSIRTNHQAPSLGALVEH